MNDSTDINLPEWIQEQFDQMEMPEGYPEECQHCGVGADPFWTMGNPMMEGEPDDYKDGESVGICTECGNEFGVIDK